MSDNPANAARITAFYTALSRVDLPAMLDLYTQNVEFEDAIFGLLEGRQVRGMWRLLTRSPQGPKVDLGNVCRRTTRRAARTSIPSSCFRRRDAPSRITYHAEVYNLHAWIQMALGVPSVTPELEAQFKAQFQGGLAQVLAASPE